MTAHERRPNRTDRLSQKVAERRLQPTHMTEEEEDELEHVLWVVRDEDWGMVWGSNLPYKEAKPLKERIAGRRKSKTVTLEPMPDDPELMALCAEAELVGAPLPAGIPAVTPEMIAKRKAEAAAKEAQRRAVAAQRAAVEAQRRAVEAAAAAQKAAADAAAEADKLARGVVDDEDDLLDPEAELLEDAPIEDILDGGSPIRGPEAPPETEAKAPAPGTNGATS